MRNGHQPSPRPARRRGPRRRVRGRWRPRGGGSGAGTVPRAAVAGTAAPAPVVHRARAVPLSRIAASPALRRPTPGAGPPAGLRPAHRAGDPAPVPSGSAAGADVGLRGRLPRPHPRGGRRARGRCGDQQSAGTASAGPRRRHHDGRLDRPGPGGPPDDDAPARRPDGAGFRRPPDDHVAQRRQTAQPLPERPGGGRALVPRPRHGDHPAQRAGRARGAVPAPGPVRHGPSGQSARPAGGRPGGDAHDPGSVHQPGRFGAAADGTGAPRGLRADGTDGRRRRRERDRVAPAAGGTGAVPIPRAARGEHPHLRARILGRTAVLGDRDRSGTPRRAGEDHLGHRRSRGTVRHPRRLLVHRSPAAA